MSRVFFTLKYIKHIIVKIICNPKHLLDYRNYVIKIRFHLWPFISKSRRNKISIFNTSFYLENDTFNGRGLYSYRSFKDRDEVEIIQNEIQPGSTCIDIGSNVGFYTIFLMKIINAKKVYSFEYNENTFKILQKNLQNLNCVQKLGRVGINEGDIIVDEIVEKNEKIDFIKIDIDGEDYFALKSCEKIIKRFKPKILIEISESSKRIQGVSFLDVIKNLKDHGYICYYANKKLNEFKKNSLEKNSVINLFCKQK